MIERIGSDFKMGEVNMSVSTQQKRSQPHQQTAVHNPTQRSKKAERSSATEGGAATNSTQAIKPVFDWPIISFLAFCHILGFAALFTVTVPALVTFFVMYVITALGITLGFHRYFTHRAFKAPRWLEVVMALMGSLSLQGSLFEWVGHHRMHHAHSDTPKDPHNSGRGFWYSHIGWLFYVVPEFDDDQNLRRFARDISHDKLLMAMSNMWFLIGLQVFVGLIFLATMGWAGVLWGVFARLVFVYHVTWLVNSAAHMWGYRTFDAGDRATNCWWVGLLALGEGWHNNHHAFGNVAQTGYKWWEFDFTWQVIKFFRFMGWATDLKLVDYQAQEAASGLVADDGANVLPAANS